MGLKIDPAEVRRWEAAGLITAPKPARCGRRPPPAGGLGVHRHHDDGVPTWRVALILPGVKLVSRANERSHWSARWRRDKAEAAAVDAAWRAAGLAGWRVPLPAAVTLTRVYSGRAKPMDSDNLASGFKALRDAVAKLVGVDDADGRVRWKCRQLPGPAASVRVALAAGPRAG